MRTHIECFSKYSPDLVRLMARIIQQKQSGKTWSINGPIYSALVSHQDKFDDQRKEAFSTILTVLEHFVGDRDFQKNSPVELFDLFGKISCNSFTICDAELQSLGVGIYQTPSLLNHSCLPNCVAVFNGIKLLIHATEQIKQGDELTISYTELLCPSYQRKEDLKSHYLFDCNCPKCCSSLEEDGLMLSLKCSDFSCNGAVPRDLAGGGFAGCNTCGKRQSDKTAETKAQVIISKSDEALKEIKTLEKTDDYQAILDLAENILEEQKGSSFHKLHFSKIGILDKAMDACIYLELWDQALAFGLQTMDAYKLYYPRNHPSVGIQLFRIGKLQVYLDKLKDGFQLLLQAEAILKVTHGNHPLVQELREMIAQTLDELREEQNRTVQGMELI
ncbi:SET and MYND domain-containing protein 3 [Desmophyllum pertusum]|uniref:SET and MYND domain-containing protein 3 n=1 Tax=Desmophyllum pertusum TaxID=174260 RepID=A0A9W9YGQ9_9CNID|nr:SET and MYND domain-containing protein 3 [Desmophyllum pertusum]